MKRSPLPRPSLEQVRAWEARQREKALARVVKPRKPIRRVGRKARREADAWAACREAVIARARGLCEGPGEVCGVIYGVPHRGAEVHHVWPEDRDRGVHDPDRCLLLCTAAHRWSHANPLLASRAGLLRPEG